VSPNESTATFVGEQLIRHPRLVALQEALRTRARIFTGLWRRPTAAPTTLFSGSARQQPTSAPSSPCSRWKPCCALPCPPCFTARYSLTCGRCRQPRGVQQLDTPTDRQISGAISLDLPNNRLGLNIVAYRGGGAWLPYLPAALIIVLTLIATITLVQLRRHAHHRAETEEKLARCLRLPPGHVAIDDHRPARHRSRRTHHLRQCRFLPDDRI
jgi:hypothetical protein